jgi:DNA-directed RNA polymerase subunit L
MTKLKIEIKNRWTRNVLFEYEKENNTIKDTLVEAIKQGVDLRGANLEGADL